MCRQFLDWGQVLSHVLQGLGEVLSHPPKPTDLGMARSTPAQHLHPRRESNERLPCEVLGRAHCHDAAQGSPECPAAHRLSKTPVVRTEVGATAFTWPDHGHELAIWSHLESEELALRPAAPAAHAGTNGLAHDLTDAPPLRQTWSSPSSPNPRPAPRRPPRRLLEPLRKAPRCPRPGYLPAYLHPRPHSPP